MNRATLASAMPRATGAALDLYWQHIDRAMLEFGITTPARAAAFLANLAVETGNLSAVSENLNYSAEGLCKTWPKRFPTLEFAQAYAKQPVKIANFVYANRGGNGDEESGDGWRFRGAGGIQLTFRDGHKRASVYFGIPLEKVGDWLRTPEGAMRSAAWFWKHAGCNEAADRGDFDECADLVNIGRHTEKQGDANGFKERAAAHALCRKVFQC